MCCVGRVQSYYTLFVISQVDRTEDEKIEERTEKKIE